MLTQDRREPRRPGGGYNPGMAPYERHVFICVNERPGSDPRGCCAAKGSRSVLDRMKEAVRRAGLKGRVRVNASGCLGECERGVSVVVYPEGVWYGGVTPDDADRIASSHIIGSRPVEDLRVPRKAGSE